MAAPAAKTLNNLDGQWVLVIVLPSNQTILAAEKRRIKEYTANQHV